MTKVQKRARSPEEQAALKRKIVEVARQMFSEEGLANVSMRKLATRLGYSPGTLYLYFPSQTDLLNEIWHDDFVALEQRFNQVVGDAGPDKSPSECLATILRGYAHYWFERPDHFRVMFMIKQARMADCPECLTQIPPLMRIREQMNRLVGQAMGNGEIRKDDPQLILDSLLESVQGVVIMNTGWAPGVLACPKKTVDTVVEALLKGLRP